MHQDKKVRQSQNQCTTFVKVVSRWVNIRIELFALGGVGHNYNISAHYLPYFSIYLLVFHQFVYKSIQFGITNEQSLQEVCVSVLNSDLAIKTCVASVGSLVNMK